MDFKPGDPHSIGVELEYPLIDALGLDLSDRVMPLLELFPDNPHVKPEFIQNTVEVTSSVHYDLAGLEAELRQQVATLIERCRTLGLRLAGAGTHPFSERLAPLTPLPRYRGLEEVGGLLAHSQITFATHVHLGVASGEEAITLMHRLRPYLPVLIALSANSPFWGGYDTGFAAYRHRILASSRNYGSPPAFEDWAHFQRLFEAFRQAGVVSSMRDLHWDIRPRPDLGTLEVRVMDAQPTVREAVALCGFVRALAFHLRQTPEAEPLLRPMHGWLERHNRFEATRLGLEARLIVNEAGDSRLLAELFETLAGALAPVAEALGQRAHLDTMRRIARVGPGYRQQWSAFHASGSLKGVVEALAAALEAELEIA